MSFLKGILEFLNHLFSGAQKSWKKLSPEVQQALIHGSGVLSLINTNLEQMPDFIMEAIKEKFPELNTEKIKEALKQAAKGLQVAESENTDDLLVLIATIQRYLKQVEVEHGHDVWANISGTIARGIAIFLAPAGTKFAAISALMEFVYRKFIKPNEQENNNTAAKQA